MTEKPKNARSSPSGFEDLLGPKLAALVATWPPECPPAGETRSRRKRYLDFLAAVVAARGGRCQSCGHTAEEVGEPRLRVHHLMSVAMLGPNDPATFDSGNVLVLCSSCHSSFHPLKRVYSRAAWSAAGRNRGRRL